MITSKELMALGAISRATLNNYIALGILPRPVVKSPPAGRERARKIGYFPDEAAQRIKAIHRHKDAGLSLSEIAEKFAPELAVGAPPAVIADDAPAGPERPALSGTRVTLDSLENPAYMVNYNFEVVWANAEAMSGFFGLPGGFEPEIEARGFFKLLFNSDIVDTVEDREELLRFHLAIAKLRLPKRAFTKLGEHIDADDLRLLHQVYDETEAMTPRTVATTRVNMAAWDDKANWRDVHATVFREGILFVHQSAETPTESIIALLARRYQPIRHLFRARSPVFTPLCVMVADLQDSVKICAELPPEEYFELINQIWKIAASLLRKYHATQGKHTGDGVVSYFFPRPDRNYLFDGLRSARELKENLRELSHEWQLRKNWTNEIFLNIGLNEGQEWFGTYHSDTYLEFTVLGDTINHARRLSEFARFGSIWATKNLMGKLSAEERDIISFGIRRTDRDGRDIQIPASYSRLANLIDFNEEKFEPLRDIASLPVTEVWDIKTASGSVG